MIGSIKEFETFLLDVNMQLQKQPNSGLGFVMNNLHCAGMWELHELPEVVEVTSRLNECLQRGGLGGVLNSRHNYDELEKLREADNVLTKRLGEHQQEYMGAMAEQLILLSTMYKTLKLSAITMSEVHKLLQVEETFNRLREDYRFRLRGTDHRHDWCKGSLVRLEEANALYRKLVNAEEKKVKPAVTTIKSRRNVIVANFSAITFYIDVGGEKLYDCDAAIIAGFCYRELFKSFGSDTNNPMTTGALWNLSVCFKHTGGGQGEIVYQEEADAKTIKSFEDTLYNKPNTNQS